MESTFAQYILRMKALKHGCERVKSLQNSNMEGKPVWKKMFKQFMWSDFYQYILRMKNMKHISEVLNIYERHRCEGIIF